MVGDRGTPRQWFSMAGSLVARILVDGPAGSFRTSGGRWPLLGEPTTPWRARISWAVGHPQAMSAAAADHVSPLASYGEQLNGDRGGVFDVDARTACWEGRKVSSSKWRMYHQPSMRAVGAPGHIRVAT